MTPERVVLLPPPRARDRVPGPVLVLLWVALLAGVYLWAGLKGGSPQTGVGGLRRDRRVGEGCWQRGWPRN